MLKYLCIKLKIAICHEKQSLTLYEVYIDVVFRQKDKRLVCSRLKEAELKSCTIDVFILPMDVMTLCNVKGAFCSDEATENFHS